MEGCEGCGEDVAVSHLLLPITPDCSSDPGSRDPDCPSLGSSLIYYLSIIYLSSTLKALSIETQSIIVYRYFLAAVVLRGGVYQLSNPFHVLRLRKKRGIRLRDLNFTAEIISAGYRECGEGAADTWRLFVQLSHGDTRPWED